MSDHKYDRELFVAAHGRFLNSPTSLTDTDIAQLALVDQKLGERARAARAGYVEAKSAEDRQLEKQPMTVGALLEYQRDILSPMLATHRVKAATLEERIVALEQRLLEVEATLASLLTVPHADR